MTTNPLRDAQERRFPTTSPDPAKTRVLHAIVPESVHWHVRAMASQSKLPVKTYLAKILAVAGPFESTDDPGEISELAPNARRQDAPWVAIAPIPVLRPLTQ